MELWTGYSSREETPFSRVPSCHWTSTHDVVHSVSTTKRSPGLAWTCCQTFSPDAPFERCSLRFFRVRQIVFSNHNFQHPPTAFTDYSQTCVQYVNKEINTSVSFHGVQGSIYKVMHSSKGFTVKMFVCEQLNHIMENDNQSNNDESEQSGWSSDEQLSLSEKIKSEVGDVCTAEEEEKQQKRAKLGFSHSLAEGLPPCMRVVVKESSDKEIKVGALFVIPYTGGSIGRNRDCVLCLDDVNISKQHAKLYYCKENDNYVIQDLGSRNGTWLNSVRLSETKEVSELFIVAHDSTLKVGGTELLCHVHPGLETCEQCEPGLLKTEPSANVEVTSREDLESQRKKEMKKIREKFGLKYHEESEPPPKVAGYVDRAESRRQTVGVDYVGAKAEVASTKTPIPAKNKGFQLLAKMGWNEGSSLGKTESSSAIIEPV
nr:EOG090X0AIB [Eulimnadia texana]